MLKQFKADLARIFGVDVPTLEEELKLLEISHFLIR